MREYIFVQIVMLIIMISVMIRIVQNIRVDRRIDRVFKLKQKPSRYLMSEFERLPIPLQKYLDVTEAKKRQAPRRLKINFRGMSRQKNQKNWWRFILKAYINLDGRTYLMDGCMRVFPGVRARFIDELMEANGKFEFYMSSMFKYKEGDGEAFNYNSALNFLVCCFLSPIYLAQEDFKWETFEENLCDLSFKMGDIRIHARVIFDEMGYVRQLNTERYRDIEGSYRLYPFEVQFEKYHPTGYYNLPSVIRFGWIQDERFYNDYNFEIIKYSNK